MIRSRQYHADADHYSHCIHNACYALCCLLICITTVSCNKNDLPKYVVLNTLRVLALRADSTEAHPGDTITITPIISDINGSGRALTYSAEICLDPGTQYGATATCTGSTTRQILNSQSTAAAPASQATGTTTTIAFQVPTNTLAGVTDSVLLYNGVPLLFLYQIFGGTESVTAFKRIWVVDSTKTSLNHNPGTAGSFDILFNGVGSSTVTSLPGVDQILSLSFNSGDREAYSLRLSDGSNQSKTEDLTTTWFTSDGSMKYARTVNDSTTTWTPPTAAPTGRKVLIAIVIHDGRGGVGFQKIEF